MTSQERGLWEPTRHPPCLPLNRKLHLMGKANGFVGDLKAFPSDRRERFRGRWPEGPEEVGPKHP